MSGTGLKLSPRQWKAQPAPAAGTESSTTANAASCGAAASSLQARAATASASTPAAASPASLSRAGPSTTSSAPQPCACPAEPALRAAQLLSPEAQPLSAQDKLCSCVTELCMPPMRPLCHTKDALWLLSKKSPQLIHRSPNCPVTKLVMRMVIMKTVDVVSVVGGTVYTEPKTLCAKYLSTGVREEDGTWLECEEGARQVFGEFADSLRAEERAAEDGDDPSALINPILFWDVEAVNGTLYLVLYSEWQPLGSVYDHLLGLAAAAKPASSPAASASAMDWVSFLEAMIAYVRLLIGLVAKGMVYSDGKFENAVLTQALGGVLTALLIDLHGTGLLSEAPCAGGKTGRRLAEAARKALLSPMPSTMSTRHTAAPEQRVSLQPDLEARRAALRKALEDAKAAEATALAARAAADLTARSALAKAHGLSARRGKPLGRLFWKARQEGKAAKRARGAWLAALKAVDAVGKDLLGVKRAHRWWCHHCPGAEALLSRALGEATWAELRSYCPEGEPESFVCLASHVWQLGGALLGLLQAMVAKLAQQEAPGGLGPLNEALLGELTDLAEACMVVRPSQRPALEWVLQRLEGMRDREGALGQVEVQV